MPAGPLRQVLGCLRKLVGEPAAEERSDGRLLQRFINDQDERAFELLLQRHGPMVLGACGRLLGDPHLAEDAFQATFLVLVRKAHTIQPRDRVGNWLYGVAVRVARKARAGVARRREHPQEVIDMPSADPAPDLARRELRAVLDHEVERLPDKYREPFVLSYFQGKTNAEVAQELGCPEGTVFGRLARARERLRYRLERRGLALSTAALGTLLIAQPLSAAVPADLAVSTLQVARLTALGKALAGASVSASVSGLVKGALQDMFMSKLRRVLVLALSIGLLAVAGGFALHGALAQKAPPGEPAGAAVGPTTNSPAVVVPGPRPIGMIKTGSDIFGMAISPDGKLLATAGEDKNLRLWDVASGKMLRQFPVPGPLGLLKFSQDGKMLAGTSFGLYFFDVATGKELFPPLKWTGIVEYALAADGKTVALPTDKGIRVVDLPTGKDLGVFDAHLDPGDRFSNWPLAFSPDGKMLASGGQHLLHLGGQATRSTPAPIRLWDIAAGKLAAELAGNAKFLAFTADGKGLISYTRYLQEVGGQEMVLWDVATRKERLRVPIKGLTCLSSDGKTLVEHHPDAAGKGRGELRVYPDITVSRDFRTVAPIDPGKLAGGVNHPLLGVFMAPHKEYLLFQGIEPRPGIRAHYECARFWDLSAGKEIGPAN